jgi:hypothetical protein
MEYYYFLSLYYRVYNELCYGEGGKLRRGLVYNGVLPSSPPGIRSSELFK